MYIKHHRFSARFKSTSLDKIFTKGTVENIMYVHMQTQVKKIVKYFDEKQLKSTKILRKKYIHKYLQSACQI